MRKYFLGAAVMLAIVVVALTAASPNISGQSLLPDQSSFDGDGLVPAPRTVGQWVSGSVYSDLLYVDDVVRYDGFNNINVSRDGWPEWLTSFSIESDAWVIRVTESNVDISWRDPTAQVFVTEGEPASNNAKQPAYNY